MATRTVSDLRKSISSMPKADQWEVAPNLQDTDVLPVYSTGNDVSKVPLASTIKALDFKTILGNDIDLKTSLSTNRFAFPDPSEVSGMKPQVQPTAPTTTTPTTAAPPSSVDWSTRYGGNWLQPIQNQYQDPNCWAFSSTALVETMVRISHGVWSKRSEGDIRDGWGGAFGEDWAARDLVPPSKHGADVTGALDWIVKNGLCDYDCYPWYIPDHDYTPTSDRNGRTVKVNGYTNIGSTTDQKTWIDSIGPIICSFDCYDDFFAWSGTTPYKKSPNAKIAGGHTVLITGYDDNKQCWLIRNSWGPGWGNSGYGMIAYGECNIDNYSKHGVQIINPDPWTRRRLHNGCMIQSGNGAAHRNFELLRGGAHVQHLWREGSSPYPWANAGNLVNPNDTSAGTGCIGMPALTSTSNNRNFDAVYWENSGNLRHWTFDEMNGSWVDNGHIGNGSLVPAGYPGFIQSNINSPGQFEIIIRGTDGTLRHWVRPYLATPWTQTEAFGSNIKQSGPSFIQGNVGNKGHFYTVAVLNTGELQLFWKNNDLPNSAWNASETFGSNFGSTPPCMIQGQYGATTQSTPSNFELCIVGSNGQIQHWWRNNGTLATNPPGGPGPMTNSPWSFSASFGSQIKHVWGLIESSYGYNLEVIAERQDGQLQHFWRDGAGWHDGPILSI